MGLSDLCILLYSRGCVLRGGVGVCLIFMLILLAVSGLGFRLGCCCCWPCWSTLWVLVWALRLWMVMGCVFGLLEVYYKGLSSGDLGSLVGVFFLQA